MLKLRRIISSESWVPEIDGLRFFAIVSVMIFHCSAEVMARGPRPLQVPLPHWFYVSGNFDRGVALFFVISGFVLARPFYHQHRLGERKVVLAQYFARRLTRLEPPYLLCLAIYFVAFSVIGAGPGLLKHTLVSAAYLHNLVYPYAPPPDFVTWSLEVEVQFYLIAPLLAQVFRIRSRMGRRTVLVCLTLAGCAWSAIHSAPPVTILTYAGFFPAGFLLADLFDDPESGLSKRKSLSWGWDAVGLALWATIFLLPWSLVIRAFLPVLILPAYMTVFCGRGSRWLFSRSLLTTIGGMCYSLYLLHPLVMSVAFRGVKHLHTSNDVATYWLQIALLLCAILLVGGVYFVLIERPCMNKRWPQELVSWVRVRVGLGPEAA